MSPTNSTRSYPRLHSALGVGIGNCHGVTWQQSTTSYSFCRTQHGSSTQPRHNRTGAGCQGAEAHRGHQTLHRMRGTDTMRPVSASPRTVTSPDNSALLHGCLEHPREGPGPDAARPGGSRCPTAAGAAGLATGGTGCRRRTCTAQSSDQARRCSSPQKARSAASPAAS